MLCILSMSAVVRCGLISLEKKDALSSFISDRKQVTPWCFSGFR